MTIPASPAPATKTASLLPLLGNLLEWYDFAIYGYLAQPLGDAFFPAESSSAIAEFLCGVRRGVLDASDRQPGARPWRICMAADGCCSSA